MKKKGNIIKSLTAFGKTNLVKAARKCMRIIYSNRAKPIYNN